jgi:hypothetical protein
LGRNIMQIILLVCAVRVIYVLPKEERRVYIMKNEIRFILELKQRPKLAQEIVNVLGTAEQLRLQKKNKIHTVSIHSG